MRASDDRIRMRALGYLFLLPLLFTSVACSDAPPPVVNSTSETVRETVREVAARPDIDESAALPDQGVVANQANATGGDTNIWIVVANGSPEGSPDGEGCRHPDEGCPPPAEEDEDPDEDEDPGEEQGVEVARLPTDEDERQDPATTSEETAGELSGEVADEAASQEEEGLPQEDTDTGADEESGADSFTDDAGVAEDVDATGQA